ncbi:MAG TPA: prohibitin family protein [Opitutaceae bacterium]
MSHAPIDIPSSASATPPTRRERLMAAFRRWYGQWRYYLWLGGFIVTLLVLALARHMFFTIPSGHAGVVFQRFFGGTETQYVRDEGFQFIFAWDGLAVYDVRIQQVSHTFDIISKDGLEVKVTLSIRYRPRIELLGVLHKEVGPDYVNIIVIPEVQALARATFGAYTPEEMYTTKRSLIEETLHRAVGQVGERYVSLDDLLVKEIKLPPLLQTAIENKLVEQQNAFAMQFRIEREKQEAERKIIEGGGVARFNELVRPGLGEDILRYKGIEATLKLSESANAKVVVIGDKNGLPLILDTSIAPGGARPGAPATTTAGTPTPAPKAASPIVPAATPDSVVTSASAPPPVTELTKPAPTSPVAPGR